MKYISTSEAAKKCGLSRRRIAILCKENRIEGVQRAGQTWKKGHWQINER